MTAERIFFVHCVGWYPTSGHPTAHLLNQCNLWTKENIAMSQLLHIDAACKQWILELSLRYRRSRIKASFRVNSKMLRFYWSVGKDIAKRQFDNKYGSHFYENLSRDLVAALNIKKGFSPTNLKYTKYFYNLYSPLSENRRQPADELVNANRQQPADDFEQLFCIPWSHHQKIIDKVQGDSQIIRK